MSMQNVVAVLMSALIVGGCSTPPPDQITSNAQTRFEEQQKGYADRESSAYDRARQKDAQKKSMLDGKMH